MVVINDDLAATLLSIAGDASASEALRSRAALSLGPVLEQMEWDSFDDFPGFDEVLADDPPISEHTFHRIRESLRARYLDDDVPQEAQPLLVSLGDCDDAEIATAAHDALMMAEAAAGDLDEDSEL